MKKNILIGIAVLLTCFSLYLGVQASPFYENLTYIGGLSAFHIPFQIYGISQSLFFCFLYLMVVRKFYSKEERLKHNVIAFACTFINVTAILSPYHHNNDIYSTYHVYGCILAIVISFLMIFLLVKQLLSYDVFIFEKAKKVLFTFLSLFFLSLILLGDISSLSEIILFNGLNYYLLYLLLIHTGK